jgi:RimJ/RimL family protein N-acetyltransferase
VRLLPDRPLGDGVIVLRPWRVEDAAWYAATAAGDGEIQRWTSEPADLDASAVAGAIERMHASGAHAGLAIADAATGALLGNAGLSRDAGDPLLGHVSYWLADHARGGGVATRAVRLLAGWAWQCGMRRVELYTHPDNVASQRVAERAGFRRDRIARRVVRGQPWDAVFYAVDCPTSIRCPSGSRM